MKIAGQQTQLARKLYYSRIVGKVDPVPNGLTNASDLLICFDFPN
jgi:hypothetical protein